MDFLTFNQFVVLLWKNFTLKRRQVFTLILEILTVLVFPVMILLFRKLTSFFFFNLFMIPINTFFLKNPEDWELIYVPSNIDVVSEIMESMKRNLNINVKVQGFASEIEFERYIEYDYGSHKVLAAIIFDCNFKSSSDPLPLQKNHNSGGSSDLFTESYYIIQRDHNLLTISATGHFTFFTDFFFLFCQRNSATMKEYQLIIGLQNWIIWAAYFFTFFFFYIIIISLICVLFSAKIFREPIFRFSDSSFIFVFLMCHAIASIFFAFMVSTFFNKVHLAASAGSLLYFATFFPFNTIIKYYGHMTLTQKVTVCLSSNVALALGISRLLKLELKQIGVRWDNIWRPVNLEDNLIFGYILLMLLLDAFLYGIVTWYMETIFPGQCDVPQPWYFFLLRSYWLGETKIRKKKEVKNCGQTPNKHFEAEPTSLVAGIQIKHLHKGQITILLGQNGAGKTTILSLLTGRYPPTREEVYIHGFDISKNIMEIRKNLGFCPQQDLLFNDLTISEHLFFYSVVKRIYQNMYSMEIDHMLSSFNLLEKRDTLSKALSGGMKRKLSIIIALMGGSQVVLLDEPSSGMDPVSRRATWELLQQYKQNRTILLTTHYMDEADLLGDPIAIMVRGTLQCCGSSVFLKQTYEKHLETILLTLHTYIPVYRMCLTKVNLRFLKKLFEALIDHLEKKQKELGIASFGASITTMEEVFVKVNNLADSQMDIQATHFPFLKDQKMGQDMKWNMNMPRYHETSVYSRLNEMANIKVNTGFPLYCQQFHSMFIKRALFTWRNWKLMLLQISVILVFTTYLLLTVQFHYDLPTRELDLSQYGRTIVPYSISGNSDLALNLINNLKIFLKRKNQELWDPWVAQRFGACLWPRARSWRPGIESHVGLPVHGACFCLSLSLCKVTKYLMENKEFCDFSITALSIEVEENKTILTVLFNNKAYHSAATSLAVLDNVLFMSLSGPNASIKVANKPQPLPLHGSHIMPTNGLQIVICLAFSLAVLIGTFCLQTVTERTTRGKHIQFVSGVSVLTYWLSAFLWDLIYFSIFCCLLLGVFTYCRMDAFVANYNFLDTMMILMLYGWSAVPLMYLGSFLFSSSTAAYIKLTLFNYFSTIFSISIYIIRHHYDLDFPHYIRTLIDSVLVMLPSYNFAMSISKFFNDYEMKKLCTRQFPKIYVNCSKTFIENSVYNFGKHGIAKFFIALAILGLFYLPLLLCLETTSWSLENFVFHKIISNVHNIFTKGKTSTVSCQVINNYEDEVIKNEENRALALPPKLKNTPLVLKELTKIYYKCPVVKAIRNISLVVQKYECFGLLGLNGAGKTTTFKILTGEETTTSGAVLIDGFNITKNIRKPSLLSQMSGFLYFYESSVVFLDELSTGLDPVARCLLWNTITWMCRSKAIIITSHSMEECEALCTRLAIMVKGKFKCLGSPQHLKNKFGNAYSLTAKIKFENNKSKLEKFKEFIATTFPGYIINQEHQGIICYYIPKQEICWGKMFSILEEAKALFNLEDYSVSRITLEQIFLTIANIDKTESIQEIKLL
ncbi:unnamed protein product [Nyctereutes procyonoides]|uniref:(raccoon dog) hypothetical protein n=1 Tax=Nyctereutes procyonoides TaxID=34880 RepID=A0A811Z1U2_NYCPR|nr:unnamed protein product [Nyctereutes procyonoides]